MALDSTPGCCGTSLCTCSLCFEEFFCHVRHYFYPPGLAQALCKEDRCDSNCSVFDGVIATLIRPMWEIMRGQCGVCTLPRELDPLTACCLCDCWAQLYGIEECFDVSAASCWANPNDLLIAKRAALQSRALLEWHSWPDLEFYRRLACPLGIEIDICVPTFVDPRRPQDMCDITLDWGPPPPEPRDRNCGGRSFAQADCEPRQRRAKIIITGAPKTIYATMCSPLRQPLCWNPYVDAFKCLVNKLKPCSLDLRFEDRYEGNWIRPPAFDDLCPTDSGVYARYPIVGEGTSEAPFTIDWHLLSTSDLEALACRLAQVIQNP